MSLENFPNLFLNYSPHEMNGEEKHVYRFKSFRLDVGERLLLRDEAALPLTPKAFDVLTVLVERAGHLVEKDELLKLVWTDSFVEEVNVARIVHMLRKTLGEDENGNKFIETVAKKGYRFVAEVSEVNEQITRKSVNNGEGFSVAEEFPETIGGEKKSENEFQAAPSAIITTKTRSVSEPKQPMRVILFSVGFLTAIGLLLLLSFNYQSGSFNNTNKLRSIAILPIMPINAANRDELYEIGIADSLIHQLSATKSFYVRPLSATRQYTVVTQDPVAAGKEQKTDYVLASNYQLADGRIRVTAQLINVATGQAEETYKSEKDASRIFAAQDAIASDIGNFLFARFAAVPNKTTARRGTDNEEAYRLYLHGKNLTARRNQADAKKAIEYFEQAVRLDPNYALAFAGIAHAYSAIGTLGGFQIQREVYEKAHAALNKAAELDAESADVYAIRGELKLKEWDFTGAENDLKKAIELEPNNDLARSDYAMWLSHHGRFDESLAEIEIALEIDPNSLEYQRERGRFFYFARRYDEAITHLERVLEIDKNFTTTLHWLILACEKKGDYDAAFKWNMEEYKRLKPERTDELQKAYETGGWEIFRRKILEFEKIDKKDNFYRFARHHALLGEKEQAFENLNIALERRQTSMTMLKVEPAFDSLRDDPRFDELLMRVGLK
jgi:DNA-binding winged helix-turn-helix (wHTH) protein/tetratricopeptide (TPR) repeat protein